MPEFALWKADYELEPWGELRSDRRAAAVADVVLIAAGKNVKMTDLMDHVNPWRTDAETPAKAPRNVKQKIRLFNASISGRIPKPKA